MNLTDVYRTFHKRIKVYISFKCTWIIFKDKKVVEPKKVFFNFLLLFNYSCVPFLPIPPPHLHPPPWFGPCVLYSSSCNPLSSLSPPHSPLPIVRLFLTSMSLVIFCFLFSSIDYVPVKGEIIWCLSLTIWLISLSIMLSSFIHAVAKVRSSFFLSAA